MASEERKAMKIIDKIRKWCNLTESNRVPCDELRELADRIDCELVELPMDMDSVPIRVGDVLHDCEGDEDMRANALRFNGKWEIRADYGYTMPRWCVHKRPDSFWRIADDIEAAEDWCDQNGDYGTGITSLSEETLRGWVDRIRKLAEMDGK